MKIVTTQFAGPVSTDYKKLLEVFKKSVSVHMPEADFIEILLEAPDKTPDKKYGITSNSFKLASWVDFLKKCNEEDKVIFCDCDMLMLKSAEHAFDSPFDIAYTRRYRSSNIPINSGIVFVRPTKESIEFFEKWLEVNDKMFVDSGFHRPWRDKYRGINQAAFGYLLEEENLGAKLIAYDTRDWNAVDCDWPYINDNTVFLHIKGSLRCVLQRRMPHGSKKKAMNLWYDMAGIEYIKESGGESRRINRLTDLLEKKQLYKEKINYDSRRHADRNSFAIG